jgi:hypothetical protein
LSQSGERAARAALQDQPSTFRSTRDLVQEFKQSERQEE